MVEDINIGRFFELATTDRQYVNGLNLHEIKNDILEDYTGDFELIGSMLVGEIEQKTNIRFKNVDDFESYINAIGNSGYDSENDSKTFRKIQFHSLPVFEGARV